MSAAPTAATGAAHLSWARVTPTADGLRLRTPTYTLTVAGDRAEVTAPGAPPLLLSLLTSLDTLGGRDETHALGAPVVVGADATVRVEVPVDGSRWQDKRTVLECGPQGVGLRTTVRGTGRLTDVHLLGGWTVPRHRAGGFVPSPLTFARLLSPSPGEPADLVRDPRHPTVLGVVGDSRPGRVHGLFSPPPLCLAVAGPEQPPGTAVWSTLGVDAPVGDLRFTALRYLPADGGYSLRLDYEGHTRVRGAFTTPTLLVRPCGGPDPYLATADHCASVTADPQRPREVPDWWRQPLFCGWGAQCFDARGTGRGPADLCTQQRYDAWLDLLADHGVVPGTVVLDDKWQRTYAGCEPDPAKWPDLRGWVADRHARGQRVLLWWKAWDPEGAPAGCCVTDRTGRPVALDPESPAGRAFLAERVRAMLSPDGLDADGLKVDFTQRTPTGTSLRHHGASWGVALLHELLAVVHAAAVAAKPDALVVTHTAHPAFADVSDMVRLNDVVGWMFSTPATPVAEQMRHRARLARAALPHHVLDTDDWPMPRLEEWRGYLDAKARLGVPALYYARGVDESGEAFTAEDYARLRAAWAGYRRAAGLAAPEPGAAAVTCAPIDRVLAAD